MWFFVGTLVCITHTQRHKTQSGFSRLTHQDKHIFTPPVNIIFNTIKSDTIFSAEKLFLNKVISSVM